MLMVLFSVGFMGINMLGLEPWTRAHMGVRWGSWTFDSNVARILATCHYIPRKIARSTKSLADLVPRTSTLFAVEG